MRAATEGACLSRGEKEAPLKTRTAFRFLLVATLAGCVGNVGNTSDTGQSRQSAPPMDEDGTTDGRPRGSYKVINHDPGSDTEKNMVDVAARRTIFLNGQGGTYHSGNE